MYPAIMMPQIQCIATPKYYMINKNDDVISLIKILPYTALLR